MPIAYTITQTRQYVQMYVGFALLDMLICVGADLGAHGTLRFVLMMDLGYVAIYHLWTAWHRYWLFKLARLVSTSITDTTVTKYERRLSPWTVNIIAASTLTAISSPFFIIPLFYLAFHRTSPEETIALLHLLATIFVIVPLWAKLLEGKRTLLRDDLLTWQAKTIAYIPQFPENLVTEITIQELWFSLGYSVEQASRPEHWNQQLVSETYAFAEWCLRSSQDELPRTQADLLKHEVNAFYRTIANSPFASIDLVPSGEQSVN